MRTCQECGETQPCPRPTEPRTAAFCNRACRKCGNESLDHGSEEHLASDRRFIVQNKIDGHYVQDFDQHNGAIAYTDDAVRARYYTKAFCDVVFHDTTKWDIIPAM